MNKRMIIPVLALILAGCAKGYSGGAASPYTQYNAADGTASYTEDAEVYYEEAKAAETESMVTNETGDSADPVLTSEKLVYRGSLTIETLTYAETVANIRERIASYKGIIQSEYGSNNDRSWYRPDIGKGTSYMNMTVRIPTASFQSFMEDMEGTGKVTGRSVNVENISRQYADNAALIQALETQEERLLEMMDKAETIEDMIAVEARLTEVQAQLNQKMSYQNQMDTDVNYSTIDLSVQEVLEYTPDPDIERRGTFAYRLQNTFRQTWNSFLNLLEGLLFGLIRLVPYVVVFGPIIFLLKKLWGNRKLGLPFRKKDKQPKDTQQ